MENYILNRKIIEVEKNKEYSFRIPALFNAEQSEFIFEVPESQFKEDLFVELSIRNPKPADGNGFKRVRVDLNENLTQVRLRNIPEIEPVEYLLFACKSNHSFQLVLTVKC